MESLVVTCREIDGWWTPGVDVDPQLLSLPLVLSQQGPDLFSCLRGAGKGGGGGGESAPTILDQPFHFYVKLSFPVVIIAKIVPPPRPLHSLANYWILSWPRSRFNWRTRNHWRKVTERKWQQLKARPIVLRPLIRSAGLSCWGDLHSQGKPRGADSPPSTPLHSPTGVNEVTFAQLPQDDHTRWHRSCSLVTIGNRCIPWKQCTHKTLWL